MQYRKHTRPPKPMSDARRLHIIMTQLFSLLLPILLFIPVNKTNAKLVDFNLGIILVLICTMQVLTLHTNFSQIFTMCQCSMNHIDANESQTEKIVRTHADVSSVDTQILLQERKHKPYWRWALINLPQHNSCSCCFNLVSS